jgi:hypothetical protein
VGFRIWFRLVVLLSICFRNAAKRAPPQGRGLFFRAARASSLARAIQKHTENQGIAMQKARLASAIGWAFALSLASPAAANEWVLGVGADDFLDIERKTVPAFLLEYHSEPFTKIRSTSFSWMVALQADGHGDVLAVAGMYYLTRVPQSSWVIEGSFGAGAMHQGSNPHKGGDVFQFRSSFGLGYEMDSGKRVSLSIDHLFDKNFRNWRPGTETVLLRYTMQF